MVRNHGPGRGKQNTARGDRRDRHKLPETWKNVPESKMKELSKAASLCQSLPQGNSYNTVVGYWHGLPMTLLGSRNENSLRSSSKRLSSALNPQATQADQKMQVFLGNQLLQPQQSRSAACAMIPNQQNFTKQEERFNFSTIFSGCQIGQIHVIF